MEGKYVTRTDLFCYILTGGLGVDKKERMERTEHNDVGSIRIADEVVGVIAGLAATEVPGVAGMSAGLVGGIAEMLGKKNLSKGVKVEVGEREAAVDLYIIVEYGVRIPDVALRVQENVKRGIESMTGLDVVEVNIHVQGVGFGSEEKDEDIRVR
ncbi:alkaline shock protein asp23 [Lucifera butyrica]|uniref:Alkaline shock protein asp23 n=1 Tax=Lucifera butyrica TaxID=1351585 RepID=A0A498R911_9FIRM|nr:alkaline shock protein asp23 [Lucifera butyrica]